MAQRCVQYQHIRTFKVSLASEWRDFEWILFLQRYTEFANEDETIRNVDRNECRPSWNPQQCIHCASSGSSSAVSDKFSVTTMAQMRAISCMLQPNYVYCQQPKCVATKMSRYENCTFAAMREHYCIKFGKFASFATCCTIRLMFVVTILSTKKRELWERYRKTPDIEFRLY